MFIAIVLPTLNTKEDILDVVSDMEIDEIVVLSDELHSIQSELDMLVILNMALIVIEHADLLQKMSLPRKIFLTQRSNV